MLARIALIRPPMIGKMEPFGSDDLRFGFLRGTTYPIYMGNLLID